MTPSAWLNAVVPLVANLPQKMSASERYRHLLATVRRLFACDAVALLRLENDCLLPLAIDGLSPDTLGRRFRVAEHPRFKRLLEAGQATRFPPDSPLPDPYDGLVEASQGQLEVHDCMGVVLQMEGEPWGLLTLDALTPGRFTPGQVESLGAFGNFAAATVAAATRIQRLEQWAKSEHLQAERYRRAASQPSRPLLGQSPVFRRMLKELDLVGASDLTVLITGETGVGKELVAQALHERSARRDQAFVSLNCAALPETLVESELFGHVRGAFTGAVSGREGKFELAHGGTLFLDEVGELSLAVQAKLLRVLQSGQLQRLGSDREHRVDVRLIVATNRDLASEVRAGRMRADIYHRLSVYPLPVPPLRERGRDVLLLSGFFLEENRCRLGISSLRLEPDAQEALQAYEWPGNVRELEHLIGRSVLKALGRQTPRPRILSLSAQDLGLPSPDPMSRPWDDDSTSLGAPAVAKPAVPVLGLRQTVEAFERRLIEQCLLRHRHNWAAAARELQMDRANLARLARRLGCNSTPAPTTSLSPRGVRSDDRP